MDPASFAELARSGVLARAGWLVVAFGELWNASRPPGDARHHELVMPEAVALYSLRQRRSERPLSFGIISACMTIFR